MKNDITYEEVFLWRSLCEYLAEHHGHLSCERDELMGHFGDDMVPLIGFDRTCRQKLWDLYGIQLIKWERSRWTGVEGWKLKASWEEKIVFLEQVYILGRNPYELPRPWIDEWQGSEPQKRAIAQWQKEFIQRLNNLEATLQKIGELQQQETLDRLGEMSVTQHLYYHVSLAKTKAKLCRETWNKFGLRLDNRVQPERRAVVLGGGMRLASNELPSERDLVLGNQGEMA